LINNREYGLPAQRRVRPAHQYRTGPPTPDDLDELITRVWKEPGFFLLHPAAIAGLRQGMYAPRRSSANGVVVRRAVPYLRGLPLIPSDKVPVENGKSKILLLRTGESRQGVVGLYQPGLPGEQSPGLSVRFMGINHQAIASYLVSLYCSLAVLVDDAVAVLDEVAIDRYHEYK